MGCPVSGTELEMLIAAIDVDCGGTVTIDEFLDFLKKARPKDHKRRVRPLKKWMPHERWGGPSMNPAPNVARKTPQYKVARGGCCVIRTLSNAVMTT